MAKALKLDIRILDTHHSHTLAVGDASYYPPKLAVINPTLEIEIPGFGKSIVPMQQGNITLYTSTDLGITCGDGNATLPDGVYKLKYTISPPDKNKVEVSFLRTDNLQLKFGEAFLNIDMKSYNTHDVSQQLETIDKVWYFIQGAIAASNKGDYTKAMDLYRFADNILSNFLKTR